MAYATVTDLAAYTTPPTGAALSLEHASRRIDRALVATVYNPLDPVVVEALRDATCEQVVYWLDTGDEVGAAADWDSVTIGSVSMSRSPGSGRAVRGPLAPLAADVLTTAGLLPGTPIWT